ncbi:Fur family transcriptional regulator [Kitasatospora sp. NPDC054939]
MGGRTPSRPPAGAGAAGTAPGAAQELDRFCRDLLRSGGGRCTAPRLRVLAVLRDSRGHLPAATIHQRLRAAGDCTNLSTVYRSLERLTELGLVHSVRAPGGESSYGLVGEPHHHAVCTGCGEVREFPHAVTAGAVEAAARHTGFRLESLTFTGVCADCC